MELQKESLYLVNRKQLYFLQLFLLPTVRRPDTSFSLSSHFVRTSLILIWLRHACGYDIPAPQIHFAQWEKTIIWIPINNICRINLPYLYGESCLLLTSGYSLLFNANFLVGIQNKTKDTMRYPLLRCDIFVSLRNIHSYGLHPMVHNVHQ